jgi:hypothetical protein
MRQTLQATVTLSVSIVVTFAVLAVILPDHPASRGEDRVTVPSVRLAVLSDDVASRVVVAGQAVACPFLTARATAAACPGLAEAAPSACPFLAGRVTSGACPYLGSSGDAQPQLRCPRAGGGLPAGPPSEIADQAQLPLLAVHRAAGADVPSELS